MRRRAFLRSAALLAAAPFSRALAQADKPQPFDFARLKGQARALAAAPYQAPPKSLPRALADLDWDQYQAIRFRPEHALWADRDLPFRLSFFHLGRGFREPVRMHEVADGQARRIGYDPGMFDLGKSGLRGAALPRDLDFAGFRV